MTKAAKTFQTTLKAVDDRMRRENMHKAVFGIVTSSGFITNYFPEKLVNSKVYGAAEGGETEWDL